ncbi:MAG: DUF362 domain-containing protein [Acidobacteriia bacterium]|nr:DUF362 domain-containing protein [Terriglobia bacterium]
MPHDQCPRRARSRRQKIALLAGLASLIWFLVRVIPKPSRASYPCQRAAAPLASGFVIWLVGLLSVRALKRSRYALAGVVLAGAVVAIWLPLAFTDDVGAQEAFVPSDAPNTPIGVGKGIFPGRVVWAHEPAAAKWDGKTGDWWDDANSDQRLISTMLSGAVKSLAGKKTEKEAWDALFRHFNLTHGAGKSGYRAGEKIAIKINENQNRSGTWTTGQAVPSPHMVYALVASLIEVAGVRGENITVYDASRVIGEPIVKKIRANASADFQAVRFVAGRPGGTGQIAAESDPANAVHFADPAIPDAYLPKAATEARYLINFALLRAHILFGVTLTAKNHFGEVYFPNNGGWTPRPLHAFGGRTRPLGSYNCLVDLMGHKQLGGKTLLYLVDGLYPGEHNETKVTKFASFGDQWAASLLASQDPVAIDSVGLDFLRNEPKATQVRGTADAYLHEAALAAKPPSGTVYDPAREGKPLASLGVHEHWNNATGRQYSRNLGKQEGIELVTLPPSN